MAMTNPETRGGNGGVAPGSSNPCPSTSSGAGGDFPRWDVRFTWEVVSGLPHPKYTYTTRESESRAIDCAVYVIDHPDQAAPLRLVEAHVKAPGRDWVRVE